MWLEPVDVPDPCFHWFSAVACSAYHSLMDTPRQGFITYLVSILGQGAHWLAQDLLQLVGVAHRKRVSQPAWSIMLARRHSPTVCAMHLTGRPSISMNNMSSGVCKQLHLQWNSRNVAFDQIQMHPQAMQLHNIVLYRPPFLAATIWMQ
jgi:hypothetical protein